ncbi:preprotein translocase subunit YajC, partial [Duncaniella freteri]
MLNTILLQDQAGWANIVMIVVLIAIFYFFMIRPQQKKQ